MSPYVVRGKFMTTPWLNLPFEDGIFAQSTPWPQHCWALAAANLWNLVELLIHRGLLWCLANSDHVDVYIYIFVQFCTYSIYTCMCVFIQFYTFINYVHMCIYIYIYTHHIILLHVYVYYIYTHYVCIHMYILTTVCIYIYNIYIYNICI